MWRKESAWCLPVLFEDDVQRADRGLDALDRAHGAIGFPGQVASAKTVPGTNRLVPISIRLHETPPLNMTVMRNAATAKAKIMSMSRKLMTAPGFQGGDALRLRLV